MTETEIATEIVWLLKLMASLLVFVIAERHLISIYKLIRQRNNNRAYPALPRPLEKNTSSAAATRCQRAWQRRQTLGTEGWNL